MITVICHSPEDAQFANELGAFLEANCRITIGYEEASDIVEAVERGLSDVTLALLSPDSASRPWSRDRWEPVLIKQPEELGTRIAFLLLRDCKFPALLRRGFFWDLSQDPSSGRRAVKHWLLGLGPDRVIDLPTESSGAIDGASIERLRRNLGDWPGCEAGLDPATALAFAHAAQADFEGVFWIDCAHRTRAGLLGDTAHALGLRLSGTTEQNLMAVREFCQNRRCLFIFEGAPDADRTILSFAGKTSVIFAQPRPGRSSRYSEEILALFAAWTRNPGECLRALGEAQELLTELLPDREEWPDAVQLASAMVALLKHYDRLAEAYETLDLAARTASYRDDVVTLRRMAWEQTWILEHWDQPCSLLLPPPVAYEPRQLSLFG